MTRTQRVALVAVLALTALAYAPGLSNRFVWDDRALAAAGAPSGAREAFSAAQGRYYRPLTFASLALDRRLWGDAPAGFHLTNLLLHLLNVALLVAVARRSGVAAPAALGGAALFALHPLQSEAVAYVSGRTDLLLVCGALLSCWAWLAAAPAPRRGVAVALAGGVAMLSKESGFALVAVWLWLAWRRTRDRRERWQLLAPGLLLAALLLLVRGRVSGGGEALLTWPSLATVSAAGWALLGYVRLLCWPATLQVDRLTPVPTSSTALVGGVLVLLAVAIAAAVGARRRDVHGLWSAWSVAFYLPVANLVVLYPAIAAHALFTPEHNLYAPLAGLGLLAAMAVAARLQAARWRRPALAVAALLALALSLRTAARVRDWRDEEQLFGSAVAAGAASPRVWYNYGVALLERGAFADAARAFDGAVQRAPGDAGAWANLAVARQRADDFDGAFAAYMRAIALRPNDAELYENLGTLEVQRTNAKAARAAFAHALQIDPTRTRSQLAVRSLDRIVVR